MAPGRWGLLSGFRLYDFRVCQAGHHDDPLTSVTVGCSGARVAARPCSPCGSVEQGSVFSGVSESSLCLAVGKSLGLTCQDCLSIGSS